MYMFEVCAKCGHVGKNHYVEKVFAVKANSGKEAAEIARALPRVKHHHRDAIRYVEKIEENRYLEIRETNSDDIYFQCRNIQEQRALCAIEIFEEAHHEDYPKKKEKTHKPIYHGKQTLRNPKKYINNYSNELRYAI